MSLYFPIVFFDRNGKIRTVELAKTAPDAFIGMFDNRTPHIITPDNFFWAECYADTTGFTPGGYDHWIIVLLVFSFFFFSRNLCFIYHVNRYILRTITFANKSKRLFYLQCNSERYETTLPDPEIARKGYES